MSKHNTITVSLTHDVDGEDLGLVTQVVGDVHLVQARVAEREVDQLKSTVRRVELGAVAQFLQNHCRRGEADRTAADGDVLALLHLGRWEHKNRRVSRRCCNEKRGKQDYIDLSRGLFTDITRCTRSQG